MLNNQCILNCGYHRDDREQNQKQSNPIKSDYHYKVQVAAFRMYNNAMDFQLKLWEAGYLADIEKQGEIYGVNIGDYSEIDGAALLERFLRLKGYNTILVAV